MKRLLVLLLVFVLLCSSCTLFEQQTQSPTTVPDDAVDDTPEITLQTNRTEALFTLGWSPDLSVNPFLSVSTVNWTFLPLIYEGLFQITPDFAAEPLLCQEAVASADGLTWVLTLRRDVSFSNGVTMTAADVVYSLELAQKSEMYGTRLAGIDTVTQSGQYEVTIRLHQAMGSLPLLLDVPIIRSGSVEQPLGTGPYVLIEGETESYLERVADWRDGKQPISRIYLYEVSNVDSVRDAFEFGQVDMVVSDLNAVGSVNFHSNYELWSQDTTIMQFLSFNDESPLFQTAAVRAAITHAIDRQALITTYFDGYGVAATLPAHPRSSCYDLSLAGEYGAKTDVLDVAINDAGLFGRQGKLLVNGDNASNVSAAQEIAANLRKAGLEIDVTTASGSDYASLLELGGYDLLYGEVRLTADFDLSAFFGGKLSEYAIQHDDAARLCAASLENSGNFYDLHQLIMDEGLLCPILFKTRAVICDRGTVTGLQPAPLNVFYGLSDLLILNH